MKRAVRSLKPSLRRQRRLDQTPVFEKLQRRRGLQWNCHRSSFSSITFHGGDNFYIHETNRPARSAHRTGRSKRNGQRANASGGDQSLSAFGTINEAQDSMQNLLDRLVEIDNNASSNTENHGSIAPITVRSLASNHADFYLDYNIVKKRTSIFREAGEFFDALVRSVDEGMLRPSGKHGKDLSQLAECLLFVCAQQQPSYYIPNPTNDDDIHTNPNTLDDKSTELEADEIIAAIQEVLRVLEIDWNLDVGHRHYEQAIAAACNWRKWSVASDLFEKQIDPNAGGSPVRLSIENPLALFAMAQLYEEQSNEREGTGKEELVGEAPGKEEKVSMIAEHVMDAVQRLVMVSPQDQNTYVLAAGNALGHAGCWREFNEYRKSTFLSQQYGSSLVAATLRACLLCGEYEAALEILVEEDILSPFMPSAGTQESSGDDSASSSQRNSNLEKEWQWGGARDRMDPLIRDLAMQVIGGTSALATSDATSDNERYHGYDSQLALEFFRQSRNEGVSISEEALLGVVEACERDRDWKGAFSVLRTVIEEEMNLENSNGNNKMSPWIVPSARLSIFERDQISPSDSEDDAIGSRTVLTNLGPFLASVMRNCNSSSNFGLALFALQLFRAQLLRSLSPDRNSKIDSFSNDDEISTPEEEIGQMLSTMNIGGTQHHDEEILIASMVALSGLRCNKNSMRLYEMTRGGLNGEEFDTDSSAASLVYQYSSLNQKRHGTSVLGNPWLSAHSHIDQLTKASAFVRKILQGKTAGSIDTTDVTAGLHERHREGIEEILARAMNSCTNAHQPELSLYLLEWIDDSVFSDRESQPLFAIEHDNSVDPSDTAGRYGDSVTAETILALRWTKDLIGAIEMFEGILEKHAEDDLVRWRKTIVAGLTAMVAIGRGNDAVKVFEVLDGDARSTACYTTIGRHLSKVKDWKELINLYRDATSEGYSSEELSLLAMLAVTSTRVDNRLRILRAIVDECAMNVGLDPKRWTMAKYWQLKRVLGFYHARLLMWWNDEQRAPLDEVNLAIKEFYNEKANGMRPKNDVVRAIFTGASMYDSLGLELEVGYEKVPRCEDHWVELLEEVLATVEESSVRYDPNFVDSVVRAYKSLGQSKKCVDYVSDVLEVDGTRIRKATLEDVLEAAKVEQAFQLCNDIEMLISRGTTGQRDGGDDNDVGHSSAQSLQR